MENEDLDAFVLGLRAVMERDGWRPAPLSTAAGLGATAVRDLFRKGSSPKVSTARALAEHLGTTIDQLIEIGEEMRSGVTRPVARNTVAVPGKAGAGARVYLVDDHAKGDGLYSVACPPQLSHHGIVAVEVEGDSMEPVYSAGDLLFYSRDAHGVPTEAINRKCVCADDEGRVWVKQVKYGIEPGEFSLISINPLGENLHGVHLVWAAPVRLHLPRELVRRV